METGSGPAPSMDSTEALVKRPGCGGWASRWRCFPEPVQLLYVLMFSICLVPRDKIYIDKVCEVDMRDYLVNLNLTSEVCSIMAQNKTYKDVEEETQKRVSELKLYEGLVENIPSIWFSLAAGSIADTRGRTVVMALPFIGNILSSVWLFITVWWLNYLPAKYLIISGLSGLTGGYMCVNIGLYSYLADTSSPEDRTMRMSILTGIFSLGYVVGVQAGGRIPNYAIIFGISVVLGVAGLLYSLCVLRESLPPRQSGQESRSMARELFSSVQTVLRGRTGNTRRLILIAIFQFQAFMLCLNTSEYDYLMTRLKFSWQRQNFSNYLTVQRTCRLVGLLVLLPLISKYIKVGDSLVVRVGIFVSLLSYLILMVSSPAWGGDWAVYLAAVLQLNSVTTVVIRSTLSKMVDVGEVGKVFAVLGIGQAIFALISHSLFGVIYNRSLEVYPSLYLAPVLLVLLLSFMFSFCSSNSKEHRKHKEHTSR